MRNEKEISKNLFHLDEAYNLGLIIYTILSFVIGGNGCINDYPAGRLLRDAKVYEIGGGTNEIRRLVISRSITAEYL